MTSGKGLHDTRKVDITPPFSLAATCAPAWWGRGRWPNVDWIDESFLWVGREDSTVVWRRVRQEGNDRLVIDGTGSRDLDSAWANAVLGASTLLPTFDEPKLANLGCELSGLRGFAMGSVFDGLVSSIVGQSISVAAAAVTQQRLAGVFHPGIDLLTRRFWPLPTAAQLAEAEPFLVRQSGVTWRRADALVTVGREEVAGRLPDRQDALAHPDAARMVLLGYGLVGPWTAESTLLWGIGEANAYPSGDAALLRAARLLYEEGSLDRTVLDERVNEWQPYRGWACRLLWTHLFGPAPTIRRCMS